MNDIGQPVYHVGDEAMAHAAVYQLGLRGITDVLLLSRHPEHTIRHFSGVHTTESLAFPWEPVDRERYLGELKAVVAGDHSALPPGHIIFDLLRELSDVDALLIAGGGNLNSTYGWLLYERAAVAHIFAASGKPVVVSGQTLGPELSDTDRDVLAELLSHARLVGLREETSYRLAQKLLPEHPGIRRCLDDATVLPPPLVPSRAGASEIAVTLSPERGDLDEDEVLPAYARLLDAVADAHGGRLVFLPHMATPQASDGDERFHALVAEHLTAPYELLPVRNALITADRTARADLVVTSRYHPAVFACAAGIPTVAVAPSHYTDVRIGGALRNWGIQRPPLALTDLVSDAPLDDLAAPWAAEAQHLKDIRPAKLAEHDLWWDAVVAALQPDPEPSKGRFYSFPRRFSFGPWNWGR